MSISQTSICLLTALYLSAPAVASAQSDSRFEVGGHLNVFRFGDFDATRAGLGGRISVDLSPWLAVEGVASYFPHDDVSIAPSSLNPDLRTTYVRRRGEAFAGVKVGRRGERMGLFAKVRPGLTRVSGSGVRCEGPECAFILLAVPTYRTEFALDVGGGFELYPTRRTVARIELGDTIIRHRGQAPPCWQSACTSHNFSSRVGLGLRF